MKPLRSQRAHYWLLQGMLRKSGADAVTAFDQGDMSSDDWAQLIESCRSCSAPCACRAFLDDPNATRAAPPEYCKNAEALEKLPRCSEEETV